MIIGGMGAHLNSTYGSLNPAALWDMLKSQEYRRSYMETKLECMAVMPSTGLSENVVDAICFDMARIKAKATYCEGKAFLSAMELLMKTEIPYEIKEGC